jgi:SAM-dependent methyltransferase
MEYDHSIFPKVKQTFHRHGVTPSRLLDVGCGTGTMAFLLAKEGWNVVGTDASEGMIAEARRKAEGSGGRVRFEAGDLRGLALEGQFSIAVSFYDVFNHLRSTADLGSTFRVLHSLLLPGGLLIFDVNNGRGYRYLWKGTDTIRNPAFTMVIENMFDRPSRRATSKVKVTFADGRNPIEETIIQQQFLKREIRVALSEAGFVTLESQDFAFPSAPGAGKLKTWWVARAVAQ